MTRIEDLLRKERKEVISHLVFASIFVLIISLAAAGWCWPLGVPWVVAIFFATITILSLAILIGDRFAYGRFFVEQEIEVWRHAIKCLLDTEFVQVAREPWGIVTLIVMISVGIAAYVNLTLWYGLLAGFTVGLLSVVVYILLPHVLVFLFGRVMKGPEEGVDYEDEA